MSLALSLTSCLCALHVLLPLLHPLSPPVCRVFPCLFILLVGVLLPVLAVPRLVCVQFGFPCLVIPDLSLLCSHVLSLITLTVSVPLCPSPERQFTSLHVSGSMFYVPSVYFCPV